ncbi:MAG: hypothetical protein HY075_01525 [Deltaproteobacteria bacterium]|nr:hypothetical protein [Deltaproteobacteria bacterium]
MAMNGDFSRFNPQSYTGKVKEKDGLSQAFNVLLNYWEIKPTQYESRLQELALKDVRTVSAFVPWAHVETDIYHSLKKFVRAAWAVRLNVRLFVMPELGVNYPNAGFPKDLLANISNLAVDRLGRVIYNHAAPNIFPLPSFSSPEVLKRFGNYLIKVGSVLGEVFTETGGNADFCEIVVSNSLFNYYRSHGLSLGEHGDYSAAHVMAFRDFVDKEYRSPTNGADGEAFKMQLYEGYNRHRFFTQIERLLREKTDMVFSRKSSTCPVRHTDLYNPECDPEAAYQGLLTEMFDFKPSVQRYYESIIAGGYRGETIYLGNSGIFRRFSDQEKSFLMLAALIHSGEVGVMAEELFRLSPNFQRKLRALVAFLEERRFVRQTRVTYVSASKFSMEKRSFGLLTGMAPGVLSVVAGLDAHARQLSERLVFMDPKSVIRLVELVQLLSMAQSGKIVAIPMPMSAVPNYTADAITHFEKFKKAKHPLRLSIGVPYEVYDYHLGQVVFYDPQAFWADSELPELSRFFAALLGLAEVRAICSVSDQRIHVASYVAQDDSSQRLVFLINPTAEDLNVSLGFSDIVTLAALPGSASDTTDGAPPLVGKTFELAVPRFGVLSMQVADPAQSDLSSGRLKITSEESDAGVVTWT